jgi:hypothetical protein
MPRVPGLTGGLTALVSPTRSCCGGTHHPEASNTGEGDDRYSIRERHHKDTISRVSSTL